MALLAKHVPEDNRTAGGRVGVEPELSHALLDLGGLAPRLRNSGEVALHISQEHRHAAGAEAFRQDLQCYGFAGAGRPGNQAVAVGHLRKKEDLSFALGEMNRRGVHNMTGRNYGASGFCESTLARGLLVLRKFPPRQAPCGSFPLLLRRSPVGGSPVAV